MPAEFIAPSEIRDGDPQALAELCAAGGSAVVAYCETAGASPRVAEAAIRAIATFRHRVAGAADLEPEQLGLLLLSVTRDAALREGGARVTREKMAAADAQFGAGAPARLAAGLARDMIGAVVAAAPIAGDNGGGVALRDEIEKRYARIFEAADAPRARPAAAQAGPGDGVEQAWVPADLLTSGRAMADTRTGSAASRWHPAGLSGDGPASDRPAATEAGPDMAGLLGAPEPDEYGYDVPTPPGRSPLTALRARLRRRRRRSPPPGGSAPRDRRPLVAAAIAAVALAIAAIVILKPEPAVKQGVIQVRPLDTPFQAAGAAFEVARTRTAVWAVAVRRREPRPGYKWLTLATHTRNVSRPNFHPRALGYRLRTNSGVVIGPETAAIPDALFDAGGRLPRGTRASVHLGFQVPEEKTEFSLEFDPGPGSPRIRVPLN